MSHQFKVQAVNSAGTSASDGVTVTRARPKPAGLRAQRILDGAHLFAHEKVKLSWADPCDARITGWEYQQKEGDSAWGSPQEASSTASTVTKVVDGLKIWGTYRFKVRARYGTGADDTGPESAEAVLSPWLEFTQAPTVGLLGGDGMAQFEVGIDRPVDMPDLPEGSLRIPPEHLQVQVVTVTASGETTESDWVTASALGTVLPGAALVETFSETDLPPREAPAAGASGADDQTASPQVVTSIRVSGLDPGVTYRFKVRLLRPDGVTGSASSAASVLGLRWQRQTGAVELSWTDPADPAEPAIHAWEYRQQAGSGSWGLWQSVSGSTGSTTTHTVSGLSEAVTYRFQVRGVGPGGPNAESFTVSAPVGPPSVPQRFRAAAGDRQVLLTWAAPASTGGLPLLGYHYREIVAGDTTAWFDFLKGWTRYMPQNLDNGLAHTFQVRAYTRAGAGASADTTVTPAGAPRAPGDFRAAPGDGQVTLSWTAADSNGAPITAYEVRHAPKSDPGTEVDWSEVSWSEVPGDSTARDTTITGLTNGTAYVFQAAARNRVNLGTPAEKEATPQGLVITAPDTVWFAENRTDSVATLSAEDPEGHAVTWSHSGADASLFEVRGDTLHFRAPPDFEAPGDADEDNFHEVTLTATGAGEPAASASHGMTVAVTNAPEAGTVTLNTTQPKVGMHLTATLTDPDRGVTDDRWTWEELAGASSTQQRTQAQPPPARSFRYTVEDRVKGQRLLAKVRYTDGHGPDQAASDTTAAVQADVPGAPGSLQATAGDRRVTLRWTAADSNGAWITGYAYRDSADTAGSTWSAWPQTPPIAGDATSHPVPGLDNGTGYTFEVRAVNPVGAGPASSPASATPQADTAGEIALSHSTPPKVNQKMTATLTDPDNPQLASAVWRWDRVGASGSTGDDATGAVDQGNTYTPGSGDVGYRIRATVSYTDDYGGHTVRKTTDDAVTATECVITVSEVSKTDVPENSSPTVGVYEASANSPCGTLTWSRTGSDASRFELRTVPGHSSRRSLHFVSAPDYEAKRIYSVTIRVSDPSGRAGTFPRSVRVTDVNEPPVISGLAGKSVPENTPTTATVATYSATDPEGDSVTWDLSGTDDDDFQITDSGALRFGSAPNFESPADADTDNSYSLEVVATDDGSPTASSSQTVTVTVTDVNEKPVITGSSTVTRAENGTSPWTVTTYSASDPDNNTTLYFTHRGDQSSYFKLTGTGNSRTLEFKNKPNYETRQTYKVRVVVRDRPTGGLKDSVSTTVTLTDNDDPGKVVITNTAPRVGQRITAKLFDEDGDVANDLWFWVPLSSGASGTQSLRPDATSHAYTIKARDVGKILEATVEYDDGHGPGKSAHTTSNTVSASPPGAPKSFSASRGDGEVYLSWGKADDNGSDITHYETRSKAQTASWSGWSNVSGGAEARADTFSSLTNGTAYSFEVRAENGQGEGPSASDSATPAGLPGPPKSLATARPGPGKASISWEAADANGSDITRYQYRRRVGTTGSWRGWFTVTGGGDARSRTVSGLSDATAYTWEVRAGSDRGDGPAASIYQPPAGPGGNVGQVPDSEGDNIGDNEGEPDTPMEEDPAATAKSVAFLDSDDLDFSTVLAAPNPFNSNTILRLRLAEAGSVTLTVHNLAGQVVATLSASEPLPAGVHAWDWDGRDESGRSVASGVYLYRFLQDGKLHFGKLALVR